MTMGTAATMMAIAEALGLTLPGASSIPAADSNHPRMATQSGRRIVEMVWEDLTHREDPRSGCVRERHQGAHGDGRLDQRDHPSRRDGKARRHADFARRFRQDFARGAGDRERAPVGRIPDGGFLLCGRPARADERAARTARPQMHDGDGKDRWGKHRWRESASARRDPPDERSDLVGARDRRAVRQPGAARRDHQAVCRGEAPAQASRAGAGVRRLQPHGRHDRARRSRCDGRPCAGAEELRARRADRACPNGA